MAQYVVAHDPSTTTLAKTAEKLIILLDYSVGLLTRIHGCVNFRRGAVFGQLNDKVIDHLSSKKDDPTLNITKREGHELINMKHEALGKETLFCYHTVSDILLFTNEVHPLIGKLVRDISMFDIHKNTDLTIRFLKIYFNFAKIYLLSSRMTDARIAVYLYLMAYKEQWRKDPEDAHLVKKYLFDNIHPLSQFQKLFLLMPRVQTAITDAINVILPSFTTWTSYESMKAGQYFSLSAENPQTYSHPLTDDKIELFNDATYLDHIGTWIIYLYLIFPQSLNEEVPRAQLTAALNDRTTVILYRDELIDALSEYGNLERTSCEEYRKKIPKNLIKKIIKIINREALVVRHSQMRELLRREIRGLLDICSAIPSVICVKLVVFMASLALSRYEIYWVFTHMSLKNSKNKLKLSAPYLADLMFHCHVLSNKILFNKDLIFDYYQEQLKLDVSLIVPFADQMRQSSKLDISVLDVVDSIVQTVSQKNDSHSLGGGMERIRLAWYRASAEMSKEPSIFRMPQGHAMAKLVNPLIEHTRYFDRLSKEVDARGSLATLWFYRSYLANIFNTYCLGRYDKNLNSSDSASSSSDGKNAPNIPYNRQGRYWIVFLQIYAQSLHNVHRQRPEELNQIGLGALAKAEAYLSATTSKIEVCLRNVLGQYSKFAAQIHPESVAQHLIKHRGNKSGWTSLPGFESFYPNRQYLQSLKLNLDILGDISASFAEIESIVIHNVRIYPSAYLHELISDFFSAEIRLMAQESNNRMVRPQRFLSRLERLFRACYRIGEYINIDLVSMICKKLYGDFFSEKVGTAGVSLGMSDSKESDECDNSRGHGKGKKQRRKLITDICEWYISIVDTRCCKPGSDAIYSPLLYGFYEAHLKNNVGQAIENYCSITELESLCQLIGPSGVRVIDLETLKIGHASMQTVKQVLEKNRDLIGSVDIHKLHDFNYWHSIVKKFSGLDVLSHAGVRVGSVILFRSLLRRALQRSVSARSSFHSFSMKTVCDKLFDSRVFFESISDLALDTGVVNDFTDNVMRNVYYQLANADSKLWSHIPLVFALCFADSFWLSGLKYNIQLGALSNNGFTMANAVTEMITIYTEKSLHRQNKLLFLDIAGKSLLHLKKLHPHNNCINHLFLFLDHFIQINKKDVTHMDLENASIPYECIRAHIVKSTGDASKYKSDFDIQDTVDNDGDDQKNN